MGTEPAEQETSKEKAQAPEQKAEAPEAAAAPPAEATPPQKTEKPQEQQAAAFSPWIFVAVFFALVATALQQGDIGSPDKALNYWKELTGPHVVKPPKASSDEVVIQFCQSWGTNGLYNQISQIVHQQASRSLSVRPAAYPPHPAAALAAQVVTTGQIGAIASIFLFDKALPNEVRENKMMACFALWMGGSMISNSLTKTSAFEIYVGKRLVWSSLKHKRMPNMQDLVDGFATAGVKLNVAH